MEHALLSTIIMLCHFFCVKSPSPLPLEEKKKEKKKEKKMSETLGHKDLLH